MADPTEPKKETVRVAVTPPAAKPAEARDTVRITLPSRPPPSPPPLPANPPGAGTPRPPMAKPLIPPAPNKPVQAPRFVPPPAPLATKSNAPSPNAPAPPLPDTTPSVSPKKETARIALLPDPVPSPASVQMKKTQPLIDRPAVAAAPAVTRVTVASQTAGIVDQLPTTLCWGLVGVSAVILIIQILNYIS
jgi:hypothetical protein